MAKVEREEKEIFKPLGDRVLIKRQGEISETPGGILLPDQAKEKPTRGTVMALGTKVDKLVVKPGDTVAFKKYTGSEIEIGTETFVILDVDDILGVVVPVGKTRSA